MKKNLSPNSNQEDYFEKYYFLIKSTKKDTTIVRQTKAAASNAYKYYLSLGKNLEWQGKWTGKNFIDTDIPIS